MKKLFLLMAVLFLLLSGTIFGSGQEESIIGWTCPAEGFYYVRLTNNSGHFGANVRYPDWYGRR